MDERVIWDAPEDDVWIDAVEARLDVAVAHAGDAAVATAETETLVAPLTRATAMPTPVTQRSVEIRDVAERRLVCAIEVLSPAIKRGRGRRKYWLKRGRILQSTAHLVEIDLLRAGHRVPMAEALPADRPYFAFVSRAGERPRVGVWPVRGDEALPRIPVPLLAGDADVPLDLQGALTGVYDGVGFDLILDYGRAPAVSLPPGEREWARRILTAAGKG
jgi:hypothetical protein